MHHEPLVYCKPLYFRVCNMLYLKTVSIFISQFCIKALYSTNTVKSRINLHVNTVEQVKHVRTYLHVTIHEQFPDNNQIPQPYYTSQITHCKLTKLNDCYHSNVGSNPRSN